MKLLTVAMMKPEISVDALRVNSYKELVDLVMIDLAHGRVSDVLSGIENDMMNAHRHNNISYFADNIPL